MTTHQSEMIAQLSQADVNDYWQLLKPRVMSLVIFTAFVGLALAPGEQHYFLSFLSILCISIGAGASGALNMWYDADIDKMMQRTQKRPIPKGAVKRHEALIFGVLLSVFSVMTLALMVNWLAAGLLAFTIFFYAVIYTIWLKRWTPQNIVIGGAAGAFPPVIGWVCVTGSLSIEPWVLFAMIFIWTPPHFWALALCRSEDYAKANIPMMPNIAGIKSTKKQILVYSLILAPLCVAPTFFGFASLYYAAVAVFSGFIFILLAWRIGRAQEEALQKASMNLFIYSIFYLFGLFAWLLAENFLKGY